MSTVGIIGAGAWGSAIAKNLGEGNNDVLVWAFEDDVVESINKKHCNHRYLPNVALPPTVRASQDIREVASNRDFVILASPSLYLLDAVRRIRAVPGIANAKAVIAVLTKGFIQTTNGYQLIVETLEEYLPKAYKGKLVYVSGPSHAEEVCRGVVTGLISASFTPKNSIRVRQLLTSANLMLFSSLDVVGVQVSAALKNIIAIAFGMLDALTQKSDVLGDNSESLLLAGGLNEMQHFAEALGASHPETFTSIAGIGDLDVTCRSLHGRNRRLGREIILKDILKPYDNIDDLIKGFKDIGYIPEGVSAVRAAMQFIEEKNLKMPIIASVYRILNKESLPADEVKRALNNLRKG